MVLYLFLCCLLSVLWLFENIISNDLRFDFHGYFENKIAYQIPIFQYDFKNLKIIPKLFKIRFCKIVYQIVEYPG
jgi:hypothetical protein